MDTEYAVKIDRLCKRYPPAWKRPAVDALRDVDLAIPVGQVFGLIGPNGAGKSSLIRIMMGLSSPSSGHAALFGLPSTTPAARRRIGYVPENAILYDYMTPLEIVVMGLRLHGVPDAEAVRKAREWLERIRLSEAMHAPLRTLSKGMTQRAAIAQALAIEPRMLVLDEPLSGLDPVARHEVVELLSDYKKSGGTILMTSHVLHDVERLADRIGLVHRGRMGVVTSASEIAATSDRFLVRSKGAATIGGMTAESGERWSCTCAPGELWKTLDDLRCAGHVLLEVRPTMSLEQVFLRHVGEGDLR